jgi:hypothetical protein
LSRFKANCLPRRKMNRLLFNHGRSLHSSCGATHRFSAFASRKFLTTPLDKAEEKEFINKKRIDISSSRNTVQIRGGPAAVIGDAGLHRGFPGHSQSTPWGEGRRPADDPKARRPDADVSRACIAVRLGFLWKQNPEWLLWGCSGFFYACSLTNLRRTP